MKWIKIVDKLPPEYCKVLGYDKRRGITLCSWSTNTNYPDNQMWIVNGSSGGEKE